MKAGDYVSSTGYADKRDGDVYCSLVVNSFQEFELFQ